MNIFKFWIGKTKKRSELVAKSLVKYLQKTKEQTKFQSCKQLNKSQGHRLFWEKVKI